MRDNKKLRPEWSRPGRSRTPVGLRLESLETREVPAVLIVDDDLACPGAQYSRIQAAVDAARPGDTVRVCPGTYAEQVTIGPRKDRLTLVSEVEHAAVITPPATLSGQDALVHVNGADRVVIDGFAIRGPHPDLDAGVLVDMNGSAAITDNLIEDIRQLPGLSSEQTGHGIVIGGFSPRERNGTAAISGNEIRGYEKTGILVWGPASAATIFSNEVVGAGPTDVNAQNGIQVAYGASADITGNTVEGHVYTPPGTEATGVLIGSGDEVSRAGRVRVAGNTLTANEIGVAAEYQLAPLVVAGNTVTGNATSQDGIWLNAVKGAEVSGNTSTGNGRSGVYVTNDSSNNRITDNDLRGNAGFDAFDDTTGNRTAGTANYWAGNEVDDSYPPGLG